MTFSVNDSPYAGQDGSKVTSRQILGSPARARPRATSRIRVSQNAEKDAFEVAGRGELQLAVLIENMRREGYELSISAGRACCSSTDPADRPAAGADRGGHDRCR